MEYAMKCLRLAEAHRREKALMSTVPHPECNTDYGEAGQVVATAMGHLDEALSVGQRNRAVHAYVALQAGVAAMGTYMHAAGYYTVIEAEQAYLKVVTTAKAVRRDPSSENLTELFNAADAACRSSK